MLEQLNGIQKSVMDWVGILQFGLEVQLRILGIELICIGREVPLLASGEYGLMK